MFSHFEISSVIRTAFNTRVRVRFMTGEMRAQPEVKGRRPDDTDIIENVMAYRGNAVTEIRDMVVSKRFTDEQIEIICARRLKGASALQIAGHQRDKSNMPEPKDVSTPARPEAGRGNGR